MASRTLRDAPASTDHAAPQRSAPQRIAAPLDATLQASAGASPMASRTFRDAPASTDHAASLRIAPPLISAPLDATLPASPEHPQWRPAPFGMLLHQPITPLRFSALRVSAPRISTQRKIRRTATPTDERITPHA